MQQKRKFIQIIVFLNIIMLTSSGPLQKWTYELIEITTHSSDRNVIDLEAKVVRLGRGKYGFSGFWNLKEDLNDDTILLGTAKRSKNRDGPYFVVPMVIDNQTLTTAMNKFYKPHMQPTTEKCCKNAPYIENTFEPPLTKRYVEANNCEIFTDNLPNILMPGYYKVRLTLFKPGCESYVEGLFFVEN